MERKRLGFPVTVDGEPYPSVVAAAKSFDPALGSTVRHRLRCELKKSGAAMVRGRKVVLAVPLEGLRPGNKSEVVPLPTFDEPVAAKNAGDGQ